VVRQELVEAQEHQVQVVRQVLAERDLTRFKTLD
jgi:hypothetical protein